MAFEEVYSYTTTVSEVRLLKDWSFPGGRMVGKNAVRLILSDEYLRGHPVSNVSLIMPYFTDNSEGTE